MFRYELILIALACAPAAGQNILLGICNDGAANGAVNSAVPTLLGGGVYNVTLFGDCDTNPNLFTGTFADAQNVSATTIKNISSGLTANHAPYPILGFPIQNQNPANPDFLYYTTLEPAPMMYAQARSHAAFPAGTAPGILTSYVSSPNSGDGGTGNGIEFGISASYLGFTTTSDSADTGLMASFFASLKNLNSTWSLGDVKGAFRQCAGNWATGYDPTAYGFGFINWTCSKAIASTASIFLQGPGMQVTNLGYYAMVTLYPFRTTRRNHEVLYSVSSAYVWPVKNEYTTTDITASGATLLFTGNSTDVTPQFSYAPAASGTVTFVAFTTDGSGNFSRVEANYSEISTTLTVSTSCH